MTQRQIRRFGLGAALTVGLAAAAVAGVDQTEVLECDGCVQFRNDRYPVYGMPVKCNPYAEGCSVTGQDTDVDGDTDHVTNMCLF